jgi:hypothetical protein
LKLLQERAENTLEAIGIGKDFLSRTQELSKLVSKLKRPHTEWKKIFASYTSDKGLVTRIYRELKNLNSP